MLRGGIGLSKSLLTTTVKGTFGIGMNQRLLGKRFNSFGVATKLMEKFSKAFERRDSGIVSEPSASNTFKSSSSNNASSNDVSSNGASSNGGQTLVTTLENGVTVVSQASKGEIIGVGVVLKSGMADELVAGASNSYCKLALKRTLKRSDDDMLRDLSSIVGSINVGCDREYIVLCSVGAREGLDPTLEILSDAVQNVNLRQEDVDDSSMAIMFDSMKMHNEPNLLLPELAHTTAFQGKGLGNSILEFARASENGQRLMLDDVLQFHSQATDPSKVIVVCAGVEHDVAVSMAKKHFGFQSQRSRSPSRSVSSSSYVGGHSVFRHSEAHFAGLALGLRFPCASDLDTVFNVALINQILGGGSSFSAGGPGKGMFSRLYDDVLNKHHWMESAFCSSFYYSGNSLFTLTGQCPPSKLNRLSQILANSLLTVDKGLSSVEFSRAKSMMKSQLLMNIESRGLQIEDMGRQILCYGRRLGVEELNERIDRVSVASIREAKEKLLESPLTLVTYGDFDAPLSGRSLKSLGFKISE